MIDVTTMSAGELRAKINGVIYLGRYPTTESKAALNELVLRARVMMKFHESHCNISRDCPESVGYECWRCMLDYYRAHPEELSDE